MTVAELKGGNAVCRYVEGVGSRRFPHEGLLMSSQMTDTSAAIQGFFDQNHSPSPLSSGTSACFFLVHLFLWPSAFGLTLGFDHLSPSFNIHLIAMSEVTGLRLIDTDSRPYEASQVMRHVDLCVVLTFSANVCT